MITRRALLASLADRAPEQRFASGRFREALRLLEEGPETAERLVLKARIQHMLFDPAAPRTYMQAVALQPRNMRMLEHAWELAPEGERIELLRRLNGWVRQAQVRLRILERGPLFTARGSGETPIIRLPKGPGIEVRVNGSRPLRMLLSTTAEGIWTTPATASKLNLRPVSETILREPGTLGSHAGTYAIAEDVEAGVKCNNVLTFIGDGIPFEYADGLIGLWTFRELAIRIGPDQLGFGPPRPAGPNAIRCRHMLLNSDGWLLHIQSPVSIRHQTVRGVDEAQGLVTAGDTGFSCSTWQRRIDDKTLACPLTDTIEKLGFRIPGVLGYAALAGKTIQYREGAIL